ncbi:uncharacterized protein LOC129899772 [Solanum dulcamara]|uniref:uncharacterized protein LOC129899772 n=1 Tax=Solanum dulcamara TaxID=45834 RepID=UPI0024864E5B|nr:uncharacterized protein LOC129899772 [Solanum dulcamara]
MTLEDLIVCLRIKEENKAAEKAKGNSITLGANIVEAGPTKSKKGRNLLDRRTILVKKKFKADYRNCGKTGHKALKCRAPKKKKKKGQDNMVNTNGDFENVCATLTDCNLVENPKESLATYAPAAPDETIYMKNSATAKVEGYGNVFLKMTSGKVVTLNNICHVSKMRKNLVLAGLLIKNEFKYVVVSDKVVISKNEIKDKPNFKGNDEYLTYKFRFTTKIVRKNHPYSKSNTQ